jgi:hypothetical protein
MMRLEMKSFRASLPIILLFLAFVTNTTVRAADPAPMPEPERFTILPMSEVPRLLNLCSRPSPQEVTETWVITKPQVLEIEKRLPDFAHKHASIDPGKSLRQYIGIVAHGKKIIYLNSIPDWASVAAKKDWRTKAIDLCEGGEAFWGVEFDPADNTFHNFHSNS